MANINVGGRLHSIATGNTLAGADEILDDNKGKKQSEINIDVDNALADRYTKDESYNKTQLNSLITTPDVQYMSVVATAQTTAVTDVLPSAGTANTIYRVGKWNGTQYDTTVYSEYAWDGSAYVLLDVKEYGIDDEPTAGSDNFVKSGGVARKILLANQKITDVEVISSEQYGGVVPYAFESGKTYIVTNRRSSNITISHRDTPNGDSSDILNISPNATVNYTVTSDGDYLRFGGVADFIIKSPDRIANYIVEESVGIDDEPTIESNKLVRSDGIAREELLIKQKITDVEVVSDAAGVVPYAFESGKTYIVTNRKTDSSAVISHRDTPDGESSDILTVAPATTVNYTVTSDGTYLRFGGAVSLLIKPSDSISSNFVKKNSVSTQQDYLGDGVTKRTLTVGDTSMSFATDVICQPLSRASEISITAKKGDTFVYDITGAQGTGISIEKANNRMAEFMIPSGQTNINGTYVLTDDAVSIKALLGDIVINVAYFKNTHYDSSIETLNGKVNKIVDIKYFYNSNPNYTQSGSLLEGEYYYNINGKKLYKLQNGAGVAQTIDSNTRYYYRGTLLKWTDEDGFSPDVKVTNIERIAATFNYDTLRYVYDGEKIVWTNPLPAPFVSTAFIRFAPSKDVVYTYNDYPFVFDGIHFVLNRADNIVVENEDTLTDLSDIATSFDWSDNAKATRMSQIYALFDSLVQQYPDYISRDNAYTIADLEKPSYASEYETYIYHFKVVDSVSTHIRPTVLLIGGTHGNEIWSALNLYCFMKQVCEGATANYYNMRASFNFEVVPCLNGWGIINDSRYNGNNVDINRNFDDNWESGDNTGSEAFSEAENKLVRSLTNTYTPLCAFDLHSYWGINGAAFYSVINNYDINQVIARRCIKDISRTLIKRLPSRFGSIGDGFYNIAMRRSAYEAGKDAYGTMAGWWSHTLRICGTIEVDNDISYNNGEYVSNGVEWRNGNALSVAEYVLRIQLFRYCASAINYMANTYFL